MSEETTHKKLKDSACVAGLSIGLAWLIWTAVGGTF